MAQITVLSVVNCINYVLSGICRVALLLELAQLALQVKQQKVAADCLKELKSMGEAVSVRYSVEPQAVAWLHTVTVHINGTHANLCMEFDIPY